MDSITINITNGTPDYLVELIPSIGINWIYNSAGVKILSPVPPGEYAVKVTDSNGCTSTVGGVIIEGTTTTTTPENTTTTTTPVGDETTTTTTPEP